MPIAPAWVFVLTLWFPGNFDMPEQITINRAPVLTLWAAVVAERLGYDRDAALSLGKCLAGLNAQAKGRMLGIYGPSRSPHGKPPKKLGLGEEFWIELCGRSLPAKDTEEGIRAVTRDQPIDSDKVRKYLEGKFGEDLAAARTAMVQLAKTFKPAELEEHGRSLYEQFRPAIPKGKKGWGAKGILDLAFIRSLAKNT